MTTGTVAPHRSPLTPERDSFWYLVHAEWTKFRTVRGWLIAVLVTIVAIGAGAFLGADVSGGCTAGTEPAAEPARPAVRPSRRGPAVSRSRTCSTSRTSQ